VKCRGLAVLSHPGMLHHDVFQSVFADSVKNGLAGLEVYYPRHSPEQQKQLKDLAFANDLFVTGGSDFHGSIKPDIEIGNAGITEEEYSLFEESLQKKNK
jgi:predicted metal-dependent phosphoesterase TrpH